MIERFIQNELTLKRIKRFKNQKRALISLYLILIILFVSLTAEMWANSKPLVMSYQGSVYFPVLKNYHPSVFGRDADLVMNYRNLEMDWDIWPLIEWNPYESNKEVDEYPGPPTSVNILGTDDRGRDVFSRLLYGFRYSFGYALLVWLFSYTLGVIIGSLMGFLAGRVDLFGQRVVEVFESMPIFYMLLFISSIFTPSLFLLVGIATVFYWMHISVYIRAEFLKLRKRDFVEAARAMGASKRSIVFKHILPNALAPVITFSPFSIAVQISFLANIDYLGFGLRPPTPSWGELLQQSKQHFMSAWWLGLFTSIALFISLVVLNFIGEGVRDAFDPRKL
jgi:microcin C transport system permease protein